MPPKRTPDPIVSHTNVQVIDCFVKLKKKLFFSVVLLLWLMWDLHLPSKMLKVLLKQQKLRSVFFI